MASWRGLVAVVCLLGLPAAGLAEEDGKAARVLLERAITALGGKTVLTARGLSGTSRGTAYALGMKAPVRNEWIVQGLDQVKWTTDVTLNDNPTTIVLVINRDSGWLKGGNSDAGPVAKPQLTAFRQAMAGLRLAEWLLPLTEKGWKLSSLGEIRIDDRPAVGLKARRKGLPELDLYFDKTTYLPVKAEMRILESESMEAVYVARFAEYRKVEGRQYFTKLTVHRDDQLVLDMERADFKPHDRVDDATFARP